MIERLMMRVKECGDEPARRVEVLGSMVMLFLLPLTIIVTIIVTVPPPLVSMEIAIRK